MSSNVLQPNSPHRLITPLLSLSLSSSHQTCSLNYPSGTHPPNQHQINPIFVTVSPNNHIFHRVMWPFLAFFFLVRVSQGNTGKRESSYLFTSLIYCHFFLSFLTLPFVFYSVHILIISSLPIPYPASPLCPLTVGSPSLFPHKPG